jgi:hypothetical protein
MTAPGNSTLTISLLIAFLACAGYAGGRLHQWYRTGQDRDEAYRDGYDTATRSVFSMAARIIVPKRSGSTTDSTDGAGTTSRRFRTGSFPFSRAAASTGFPAPEPFKPTPPAGGATATPHAASAKRSSHSRTTGSAHSSAAASASAAAPAADSAAEGRHTVPDELVQAATFRLAPDRVARAKVRGAEKPPEPPTDPSSRPSSSSVPKPRSS